ncbi:MAG: hypothetical protein KGJ62_06110 [Armatimonadetes bacterium]|nr:hypothetical protein [Armatimonadota bacterium]MDE2205912.1 hypothetical protein [Armatimonadota bacterium]
MTGIRTTNFIATAGARPKQGSLGITLCVSGAVALATSLLLVVLNLRPAAWAFAGGSLLSLLSAGSITLSVPFALRGRSLRRTRRVLLALLIAKVPIFGVILAVAAAHAGADLPFIVVGIGLVPFAFTAVALTQAAQSSRAKRSTATVHRLAEATAGMQFTAEYSGETEGR